MNTKIKTISIFAFICLFLATVFFTINAAPNFIQLTNSIDRISISSDGAEGDADTATCGVAVSADGRYTAFISEAGNLVAGDTNSTWDVFVHDRETSVTKRVSIASDGTQGNGSSGYWCGIDISADGRYIAFVSSADNLVSNDTNSTNDVFVHDQNTGETSRVSVASNGTQGNGSSGYWLGVSITADGQHVVFHSGADNLVSNDTNGDFDIFIKDRNTGNVTRVSVASNGDEGNDDSVYPTISADGNYIAFSSFATNLVSGDTNSTCPDFPNNNFSCPDIFVHDLQTGGTERVSIASDGTQANDASGVLGGLAISEDGRYVTFQSWASNLVLNDTNGNREPDVFVRDRQTNTTTRVSIASNGTQANGRSYFPSISANGRYVAFYSSASNLAVNDLNNREDVFVHDRQVGETVRVSKSASEQEGNAASQFPDITANGCYVAFMSEASNLVATDNNGYRDAFFQDRGICETTLAINYQSGASGSYFTVTGSNFPPNDTANISVNGTPLGTVTTELGGSFTFILSTDNADEGAYFATATVNPSATISFVIDSNEPIRPQEGSASIFDVPAGIAFKEIVFLPVVIRP